MKKSSGLISQAQVGVFAAKAEQFGHSEVVNFVLDLALGLLHVVQGLCPEDQVESLPNSSLDSLRFMMAEEHFEVVEVVDIFFVLQVPLAQSLTHVGYPAG